MLLCLILLQMFETYLQFVGIAITNAQIMEASRQEYERNRVRTEHKCLRRIILWSFTGGQLKQTNIPNK
jgi:hypothetical protein